MALFPSAESPMGVFAPKERRIRGLGEVASAPLFEGRWVFFWWPPKFGGGIGTLLEHENWSIFPNNSVLWGWGVVLGICWRCSYYVSYLFVAYLPIDILQISFQLLQLSLVSWSCNFCTWSASLCCKLLYISWRTIVPGQVANTSECDMWSFT
jgi:hypothetical protein